MGSKTTFHEQKCSFFGTMSHPFILYSLQFTDFTLSAKKF